MNDMSQAVKCKLLLHADNTWLIIQPRLTVSPDFNIKISLAQYLNIKKDMTETETMKNKISK